MTPPARFIALELDERHTNAHGFCHAGCSRRPRRHEETLIGRPVAVTLTAASIGAVRGGDWLEGHATVRRAGRRLTIGACDFHHEQRPVFTAAAIFAVTIR